MNKICNCCHKELPITSYYKKVGGKDGLNAICIECYKSKQKFKYRTDEYRKNHREWAREWRRKNPEKLKEIKKRVWARHRDEIILKWNTSEKHKRICRAATSYAIGSGAIYRPRHCESCGKPCTPHAHHSDYSLPMVVKWLCPICHSKLHSKTNTHDRPESVGHLVSSNLPPIRIRVS